MRHTIIFIFLCILSLSVKAQESYTIDNKKAIKNYQAALNSFNANDWQQAETDINRALEEESQFVEAHLLLFEVSMNAKNYEQAESSVLQALTIDPDYFPNAHFFLGQLKMGKGDYTMAKVAFEKFLTYSRTNPNIIERCEHDLKNCDFAIEAVKNPVPFDPQNMGPEINSVWPEYFPSLTTDDKTLLFTRRMTDEVKRRDQEDFYVSAKDEEWMKAVPLSEINSPTRNEGAPSLSPDGQLLIFTSCADISGSYGEGKRGLGSCDLFFSWREGNRWGPAQNMGSAINSQHWETQPSFSSDGRTLYYIRGLKKGHQVKDQDIWMSQLDDSGAWTKAVRLGEPINTPHTESSVLIHPDGQSLYFTSNGHPGMGGEDIFLSRKDKNGKWGVPVNLGYPINTHKDENSITVTADGRMALFASDREGGYGGLDLYQFELPLDFRPVRVNYMQGVVTDKETGKPLDARFELVDLETGDIMVESYSNVVDGKFLVSLPEGKDYALNVSKNNYLFHSETFALKGGSKDEPFTLEVKLSPIKTGESVVLRNVFFDTDSYVLKAESEVELDGLYALLQKNYKIKIEVSGHTDDRGGADLNLALSQNRAKAVVDYLVAKGVPAERLTAKGYGANAPIANNGTEEGRALNRRTEFKVISVD